MTQTADDVPLAAPVVGIVCNLKHKQAAPATTRDMEAEYDNPETVEAIAAALQKHGLSTSVYEADAHLPEQLTARRPDLVFNIAEGHGGRAREAQVPALLNMMDIPFTGSDETTLCIALDKALTKRLLSTYHIRTPHSRVIHPGDSADKGAALHFPVIVKPNAEGSSKGIADVSVAKTPEQLKALVAENIAQYGESVLVEEFVCGREFTVGVLGNGSDIRVFSPMEILYIAGTPGEYPVYNYTVKQDYTRYIRYECPAKLTVAQNDEMTRMAKRVYQALGCRDMARVDFRMDEMEKIYFLEINPLPGLAPGYSDFPMLAEACGVAYDELVYAIVKAAAKRCGVRI